MARSVVEQPNQASPGGGQGVGGGFRGGFQGCPTPPAPSPEQQEERRGGSKLGKLALARRYPATQGRRIRNIWDGLKGKT